MGKTSAAVKNRYNARVYDRLEISARKDGPTNKAAIQAAAARAGESVQGYILQAVRERMEREGNSSAGNL